MSHCTPPEIRKAASYRRHRRLASLLLVLVGICLLSTACSRDETAHPIDMSVREKVAVLPETEQVITYAYLPQFSHTVSFQRHHLLIRYLEAQTGLRIRQVFPDTFDEHMRNVGQGSIDISFSNPLIYVRMAQAYCTRAFARVKLLSVRIIRPCSTWRIVAANAGLPWTRLRLAGISIRWGSFWPMVSCRLIFLRLRLRPAPGASRRK